MSDEINTTPSVENALFLEKLDVSEYESVRQEILQYQRIRIQILAFTVGAVAVFIGWSMNSNVVSDLLKLTSDSAGNALQNSKLSKQLIKLLVIGSFGPYMVLLPSLVLTGMLSRHISTLGSYLAIRYEIKINRIGWQISKHWRDKCAIKNAGWTKFGISTKWGFVLAYTFMGLFTVIFSVNLARLLEGMNDAINPNCVLAFHAVPIAIIIAIIARLILPIFVIERRELRLNEFRTRFDELKQDENNLDAWLEGILKKNKENE